MLYCRSESSASSPSLKATMDIKRGGIGVGNISNNKSTSTAFPNEDQFIAFLKEQLTRRHLVLGEYKISNASTSNGVRFTLSITADPEKKPTASSSPTPQSLTTATQKSEGSDSQGETVEGCHNTFAGLD